MNFLMCCSSIYAHVMSLLSQSKLDWAWASGEGQNEWKFVFHTLVSLSFTQINIFVYIESQFSKVHPVMKTNLNMVRVKTSFEVHA